MSSEPDGAKVIGVSAGTADVLGLAHTPTDAPPTTAYLLLGGRCARDCAFCAQARSSSAPADALSRVSWPAQKEDATLDALAEAYAGGRIVRACLQVTAGPGALAQTQRLAAAIRRRAPVPVCAAVLPKSLAAVSRLLESGVDVVGFGLDAATEEVYARVKMRDQPAGAPAAARRTPWRRQVELLEAAARQHPGRVSVHLIVGLGETEREMAGLMQRLADLGLMIALFAFTPVRGTAMEATPPPDLTVYRRMQVARHMIAGGHRRSGQFRYDASGRLAGFGLHGASLRALLADGVAFQTSGCPGCNRPYYNERPGRTLYNYPRRLTQEEVARAIEDAVAPG